MSEKTFLQRLIMSSKPVLSVVAAAAMSAGCSDNKRSSDEILSQSAVSSELISTYGYAETIRVVRAFANNCYANEEKNGKTERYLGGLQYDIGQNIGSDQLEEIKLKAAAECNKYSEIFKKLSGQQDVEIKMYISGNGVRGPDDFIVNFIIVLPKGAYENFLEGKVPPAIKDSEIPLPKGEVEKHGMITVPQEKLWAAAREIDSSWAERSADRGSRIIK